MGWREKEIIEECREEITMKISRGKKAADIQL